MSVQTQNIQEASMTNAQFILNRILWSDDTIQFLEEGDTRVVEGLVMATTATGMVFAFPKIGGVVYPHDIDILEGGKLAINTTTARHDLSQYACKEVTIEEWGRMTVQMQFWLKDDIDKPTEVYTPTEDQIKVLDTPGTPTRFMQSALLGLIAHMLEVVSGYRVGALTANPDLVRVGLNSARDFFRQVIMTDNDTVIDKLDKEAIDALIDRIDAAVAAHFDEWFLADMSRKFDLLFPEEDS